MRIARCCRAISSVATIVLLCSTGCNDGWMSSAPPDRPAHAGGSGSDTAGGSGGGTGPGGSSAPDPGAVTVSRLNRAEYNNTVRDLLGTRLRPADDFPEDDFGYGYDNIGDVLSISPVLFDGYMRAADALIDEAMSRGEVRSGDPIYHGEAEDIGSTVGAVQGEAWNLWSNGQLTAVVDFPATLDHTFAVRAWASQAGDEPARMEVVVDGTVIETFDVEAIESQPVVYEVTHPVDAGRHTISVGFINDYYMPDVGDDRNLYVDWVSIAPIVPPDAQDDPIFVCEPQPGDEAVCARQILASFARRAWRRPVADAEVDRLMGVYQSNLDAGDDFRTALSVALRGVLVSPHFVFRVERDPDVTDPTAHPLDDWELASRLSYFLWSTMPDERLFELAEQGRLQDDAVLEAEVARMLDDPRSQALVDNFATQWLELGEIDNVDPDYELFAEFDEALRAAMKQETRRFVAEFFTQDKPLSELLTAEYTFVNDRLAAHYDIAGVEGAEMRRVELGGDESRGGLLTQASILTTTSYPTRISPVQRGKWVLGRLLCQEPPPPPPGVESIDADVETAGKTLREIMEQHVADPVCASCHRMMDPIGFGMSNYDAIGAWRDMDNGRPVDSAGELPDGRSFHGASELSAVLAEDPAYTRCVARHLMTYATGRGIEDVRDDRELLTAVVDRTVAHGGTMRDLITQIVLSRAFRYRRPDTGPE